MGLLRSGRCEGIVILFASQSGTAERFALRSAEVLKAGGVPTSCRALAEFGIEEFRAHARVLIVASTFGEGESPESVRGLALQAAAQHDLALPDLHYAVLALGDRSFKNFCGFGHFLDDALSASGAHRLFPTIEVDRGDSEALKRWSLQLHALIEGA